MNIALWIVQSLLALLFLFAGGMKLVLPVEEMIQQMPLALPGWFVRFIGIVEVLGGIGIILPWLLRIRPTLTPLAAAGLVIIMIGATVYTLAAGDIGSALMPLVVGSSVLLSPTAAGGWHRIAEPTGFRKHGLETVYELVNDMVSENPNANIRQQLHSCPLKIQVVRCLIVSCFEK